MISTPDLSFAFATSLLVAAVSLTARVVVWIPARKMAVWLPWLQAGAVGLLLGDGLMHMLPQAVARGISVGRIGDALALGVLGLICLECVLRATNSGGKAVFARMDIAGDLLHHLIDGVVIGAGFAIDRRLGLVVALAIVGHELPREMGNAGVLVAGGYPPQRAFRLSMATASAIPLGTLGILLLGRSPIALGTCLALAAGTTIYLACGDLLRGLWQNLGRRQRFTPALGVAGGLAFMWLAAGVDHVH